MQKDLNTLHSWFVQWQMEFNLSKCFIMNIHCGRKSQNRLYSMGGTPHNTVKSQAYLGVEIHDTLNWSLLIKNITSRANRLLGYLHRNLRKCPKSVKAKAYIGIVRPVLEYSSIVWSPHQSGRKGDLEMVQSRAARMSCNQPYKRDHRDSVTPLLQALEWETLES